MPDVDELIKKLEEDGWRLEMCDVRRVWCYRGCKLPVPPSIVRNGAVRVYVMRRDEKWVMLVAPLDG